MNKNDIIRGMVHQLDADTMSRYLLKILNEQQKADLIYLMTEDEHEDVEGWM